MDNPIGQAATSTGDGELARIYLQYREPLLRHLRQLVGDAEAAQDLYQDTFVKVLLHREQLAALEYTSAWLFRVASNTAYDYLRRSYRSKQVSLDAAAGDDGSSLLAAQASSRASEQPGSAELDARLDVKAALGLLPAHKRLALLLHYCDGYSLGELVPLVARNTGTVRSRLFRARQQFQQVYAG